MILDKLENSALYESVHPKFKLAFDYLKSTDLANAPAGKVELDGDNVFVNIVDFEGKAIEDCSLETHEQYIDIQMPIDENEVMGWKAASELKTQTAEYDADKDIAFFADQATNMVHVNAGHFIVFFPQDAHQPGIAPNKRYRKIIVKIRV